MGRYPPRIALLHWLSGYPIERIMAMVFVLALTTVVMARNSVVQASIVPITITMIANISLAMSFMLDDICVIAE